MSEFDFDVVADLPDLPQRPKPDLPAVPKIRNEPEQGSRANAAADEDGVRE